MKTFKWIGVIASLAGIVGLSGRHQPAAKISRRAERRRQRAPEQVHPAVNRLKEWPTWTAWTVERFPDMQVSFSGPEEGVGAKYEWDGKSTGQGELELKTSDPAQGVTYDLAFDHGKMPSTGGLRFAPEGAGTKVTWYADGDLGWSPIGRCFGVMMDSMMGPDFEAGLAKLKKKVEGTTVASEPPPQKD